MITPEEKAKDIVDKYIKIMPILHKQTGKTIMVHAKQCALIAVDELIKYSPNKPIDEYDPIDYFKQVKTEIEKL